MQGELRWRGANSISQFDHHYINGGAVDNTVHDVTVRRLVSSIYSCDIYRMFMMPIPPPMAIAMATLLASMTIYGYTGTGTG
jgi:hypothetical protein